MVAKTRFSSGQSASTRPVGEDGKKNELKKISSRLRRKKRFFASNDSVGSELSVSDQFDIFVPVDPAVIYTRDLKATDDISSISSEEHHKYGNCWTSMICCQPQSYPLDEERTQSDTRASYSYSNHPENANYSTSLLDLRSGGARGRSGKDGDLTTVNTGGLSKEPRKFPFFRSFPWNRKKIKNAESEDRTEQQSLPKPTYNTNTWGASRYGEQEMGESTKREKQALDTTSSQKKYSSRQRASSPFRFGQQRESSPTRRQSISGRESRYQRGSSPKRGSSPESGTRRGISPRRTKPEV